MVDRLEREYQALKLAEQYAAAGDDMLQYALGAWKVVEKRPLVRGWAFDAMVRHVEASLKGHIKRLCITVPPRMSKSTIAGVIAPTWDWIKNPWRQWLVGSHNKDLAMRDAVKSRRVLESTWYQTAWGRSFRMNPDQNQKTRYENNMGGHRIAYGFNSGVTGEGGDVLGIDDPHAARASDLEILNAVDMYEQELSTRLNDRANGIIFLIMQRLRPNDLAGHVLEKEHGWVHLCLPMEFETDRRCSIVVTGFSDPRKEDGELLAPERVSREDVETMKATLGWSAPGQLQQRPIPRGGGMIQIAKFKEFGPDDLPEPKECRGTIAYWDTAAVTTKGASHWAGLIVRWAKDGDPWFLHLCYRKMTYPEGKRVMLDLWNHYGVNQTVVENKSTGVSLIGEKRTDPLLRQMHITGVNPVEDKIARMETQLGYVEGERTHIPKFAAWRPDFDDAMMGFPTKIKQDIVDVVSMAYAHGGKRRSRMLVGVG